MSTQERPEAVASPAEDSEHYPQEKAGGPFENESELKPDNDEEQDDVIHDLYVPLPELKGVQKEQHPLTIRAVVVGVVLGTLVNASNVYLGRLKPAIPHWTDHPPPTDRGLP